MRTILSESDRQMLRQQLRNVPVLDAGICELLLRQSESEEVLSDWNVKNADTAMWYLIGVFEWFDLRAERIVELPPALIRWVLHTEFHLLRIVGSTRSPEVMINMLLLLVILTSEDHVDDVCDSLLRIFWSDRQLGTSSGEALMRNYVHLIKCESLRQSSRSDPVVDNALLDYGCLLWIELGAFVSKDYWSVFRVLISHVK